MRLLPFKNYFNFTLFLFHVFICSVSGQHNSHLHFTQLNNTNGLSNNSVNDVIQDNLGFIWIATNDGLCRYESAQQIKVFKHQKDLPNGLRASNIWTIFSDSKGILWVGTRHGGLSSYNQINGEWKTYKYDANDAHSVSNDEILVITEDSKRRLWIGTENGLNLFNRDTETFNRFVFNGQHANGLRSEAVLSILEDNEGRLWVGTWAGGLHLLLETNERFQRAFRQFVPAKNKAALNIWKIYQDKQNRLWIGTAGAGLFLMDLPQEATNDASCQDWEPQFLRYFPDKNQKNSISGHFIRDILQDNQGHLWIGTNHGLNRVQKYNLPDPQIISSLDSDNFELHFDHFFFDSEIPGSIGHNTITSIYEDIQGLLWFGTQGGVSQLNWQSNQFDIFQISDIQDNPVNLQSIYLQNNQMVWIGTENLGLIKYNLKTGERFVFNNKKSTLDNSIGALYSDDQVHLYIGTQLGITKLNIYTNQSQHLPTPLWLRNQSAEFHIKSICKINENELWIGTNIGLFRIDEKTGIYQLFEHQPNEATSISDNSINQLLVDYKGDLWIATFNGLNRMNYSSFGEITFDRFKFDPDDEFSIPSNRQIALIEIGEMLYIGTSNGLCGLDYNTGRFINFSKTKHKYWIHSLESTDDGNIWASTTEGLFYFDTETNNFRFFDKQDGVGAITFGLLCSDKDEEGAIYFASERKITRFHPQEIITNEAAPPVYITTAKVLSSSGEKIIHSIGQDQIVLNHNHYHLSLNFTGLNYNRAEKNQYAYQLEGFEEIWNFTTSNFTAVYTNLKHGEYTFQVKAANNDGVWNEEGAVLKIIVKPAFWETWWFLSIITLITFACIYLVFYYYTRQVRLHNQNLQRYNETLNMEVAERKKVEKALQEREQYMEDLVKIRTEELEIKNEEIQTLLQKLKLRNVELEAIVERRTKKLRDSNRELKRSNKDLEQFAYIASHDLQEPLRIVGNFVQLLGRKYKNQLDETAFEYIDFAVDGVQRMSNLIISILTYSRIGRKNENFGYVNLNSVLELKLRDFSHIIRERKVQILMDNLPILFCNKNQMGMVFFNIINNAIKFNKSEIPSVKIKYHERAAKHFHTFSIEDNGIGIEPEYKEKIFDIFKRLHSRQDYEGTGIGLSVCKKIIDRHGGKIWLESTPEKGTIFYFTIDKNLEQSVREKVKDDHIIVEN